MCALFAKSRQGREHLAWDYRSPVVCGGLAAALLLVCFPAWAMESIGTDLAVQDGLRFKWSEQQDMQLFGVPVVLRDFTADISLHRAARSLAANTDHFQRVLALKEKIVLSGTKADDHWVAELESTPYGVKGLVSVLSISPEQVKLAQENQGNGRFNWLPQQATLRFSQRSAIRNRRVTQQIYSVALHPDELAAHWQIQLRRLGWGKDPKAAWLAAASVWRRNSARLVLIPKTTTDGNYLFVHHSE